VTRGPETIQDVSYEVVTEKHTPYGGYFFLLSELPVHAFSFYFAFIEVSSFMELLQGGSGRVPRRERFGPSFIDVLISYDHRCPSSNDFLLKVVQF